MPSSRGRKRAPDDLDLGCVRHKYFRSVWAKNRPAFSITGCNMNHLANARKETHQTHEGKRQLLSRSLARAAGSAQQGKVAALEITLAVSPSIFSRLASFLFRSFRTRFGTGEARCVPFLGWIAEDGRG